MVVQDSVLARQVWDEICNETARGGDAPSVEIIEKAFALIRSEYEPDPQGDICVYLYCGHRREYHTPRCAFSACACKAFEDAPTAEEADAYLRGLGVTKKCDVCGQDAILTNGFVTYLMKQYLALHASAEKLRDALVGVAQRTDVGGWPCWCEPQRVGPHSEYCLAARAALTAKESK